MIQWNSKFFVRNLEKSIWIGLVLVWIRPVASLLRMLLENIILLKSEFLISKEHQIEIMEMREQAHSTKQIRNDIFLQSFELESSF